MTGFPEGRLQIDLPFFSPDVWCPARVERFVLARGGFRVRMALDGRAILLTCTAVPDGSEVRLEASGEACGLVRLRTRSRPLFLAAIETDSPAPIHWGLHRRRPPRDRRDFFAYALAWGTRALADHRRRPARAAVRRILALHLAAAAAAMARGIEPGLRRQVMPFRADLRVRLVSFFRRDERGWLRQATRACPGALLFALALADQRETLEGGVRLLDDLREGRRLSEALDAAIAAWVAAFPAWGQPLSVWHDDDRRAFRAAAGAAPAALAAAQRLLLRRAGPRVGARQLLLPPPLRFAPEDIPGDAPANARWFEVMKLPRVTVESPPARAPANVAVAFSAMASRHALALGRPPRGIRLAAWLTALLDHCREARRVPARETDPLRLLAEVDVEAVRNRPPDPRPPPEEIPERPPPSPPPSMDPLRRPWAKDGVEITPLRSEAELSAEGSRMRHCVGSYRLGVAAGTLAVFSVRVADRPLTLCLERTRGGWRVSEYAGYANRKPSDAERKAIVPWLVELGIA